jgi:spermidine synthase
MSPDGPACPSHLRKARVLTGWHRFLRFFQIEDRPQNRILWPLFLVSFACLYIEILLIRWLGTEVRVFAYFQNLALITCFLGFGLGCYRSKKKKSALLDAEALGFLLVLVALPFTLWKAVLENLSWALASSPNASIWNAVGSENAVGVGFLFFAIVLVAAFLILVVATMIPLGQWVGSYLDAAADPVVAYSVNLLGSIAGIWAFAGMSFLRFPPELWFGFAFLLFLLIRNPTRSLNFLGVLLFAGGLFLLHQARTSGRHYLLSRAETTGGEIHWSPYQKLETSNFGNQEYQILVNNVGYMSIANLSREFLTQHPDLAEHYKSSSYDAPFRFALKRDRVLIVGAGAGNDAAAALRNGAGEVDAVEIDPVIYSIGKRLHPEHPYSSPRVHVILDDARAYLKRATQQYDVIVFGLLDSHTQFSGYSNMRVDNYVYTEESFREAQRLLKPTGVLVLKFEVRSTWTWMGQRFYALLNHLFSRPPIVFYEPAIGSLFSATVFITSNDPNFWNRVAQPELAELVASHPPNFSPDLAHAPPLTTDDWPYVYQRERAIPRTYLTISLILLILTFLLTRHALNLAKTSTWKFFFLGAGFLLLETQLVSRLALYLGATWLVNCVVLSAILLMLVLANLWVVRKEVRPPIWYGVLVGSLIATYLIPWESLSVGPNTTAVLLAGAYCVSIFAAGVIFTDEFRQSEDRSHALGSNIVGAVAGGLAQNASFVIGVKSLLLLAAVFYVAAGSFAALRRKGVGFKHNVRVPLGEA